MSETLTQLPDLTALRAPISNGALKSDTLPKRLKIFNWGDNPSVKGTFSVGAKSASLLAANQRSLGFERIAIDFDHASVPGSPQFKKGKAPDIFGYGRPAVVPNDGIYLEDIEWTPLGVKKARNFEDLSPAAANKSGEVDFIHSLALCPNGALHDVTFFSATSPNPNTPMPNDNENILLISDLAPSVGLPANAKKPDLLSKLTVLSALAALAPLVKDGKVIVLDTVADLEKRLKTVESAATAGIATLSATIEGKQHTFSAEDIVKLSSRLETIETSLRTQTDQAAATERSNILVLLSSEGKAPVNPETNKPFSADELGKLEVKTLRMLRANTPATVPLTARGKVALEGKAADNGLKGRARMEAAFEEQNRLATRN